MSEHRDRQTGRFLPSPDAASLRHEIFAEDKPSSAWLAGVLAADGSVEASLRAVSLSQSGEAGRELIQEVRRLTNHSARVYVGHPPYGQTTHSVRLVSARMVADLHHRYLITHRKTLTYSWPTIPQVLQAPFLRGYVEGDGCVGIYPTPQANPMLHLSFVGTPWFVRDAMKAIPANGRYRIIERCEALAEARFNGRHAWAAANWVFADPDLYRGAKWQMFSQYRQTLQQEPPRWYRLQRQREVAMACLAEGKSVQEAARTAGVDWRLVYAWRARAGQAGSTA
ncbi:hypothetical protein AB0C29_20665 [Actinoplanes sp. NPDC048791]|uniref:hypothetical protein n=1 Tax=Actinoplanes sp. NPDC048791 TaxID=3154623 RepID=UPI0033DB73DF